MSKDPNKQVRYTVKVTSDPQMIFIQQLLNQDINRNWSEMKVIDPNFSVDDLILKTQGEWAHNPLLQIEDTMFADKILIHSPFLAMEFTLHNDKQWSSYFINFY